MHQSTTPSLSQTIWPRWASRQFLTCPIVQILLPVTFGYPLSSEAVIMRQSRRWKRLWRRSLTRSHKRTSTGPFRNCWNGRTNALQLEEITSKRTRVYYVCTIIKSARTKKVWKLIVCTSYISLVYWVECSPINWEISVKYQVESYQRLKKKQYLILPNLTLGILRYVPRVK